jgi:hypothetical protein
MLSIQVAAIAFVPIRLPGLAAVPSVHFLLRLVFRVAVTLLQAAFEVVLASVDDVKVIVGQLAHCSLSLPLTCLQFPSARFQSMTFLGGC